MAASRGTQPESVTAIGDADLERLQINSIDDLDTSVPSLTIENNVASNASVTVAVLAAVLLLGLTLRLPAARRARDFEVLLRRSAEHLVAGRAGAAEDLLEKALQLRPEQSEALWLLGWAEMQQGERAEARRHLEAALARRPESKEAARLLALLNREEGKGEGESPGAAGAPR